MKRILSVLILTALVLSSFAACGGGGDKETPGAQTAATQSAAETEPPRLFLDDLPDDLNLDGHAFNILWFASEDAVEEETGEVVNDAIYARNLSVETRLNCKLVNLNEPYTWATREDYLNKIRSCVLSQDGSYEIVSCQYATLPALVAEGDFLDMTKLPYLDFTKNYWVQQLIEETTISGRLYLCSGDITTNMLNAVSLFLLNRTLLNDLKLEDPTQKVYEGKWTFDAMRELVADVYADLNGDGVKDENDRMGVALTTANYLTPFLQAFDTPITTIQNGRPVLAMGTERIVETAEALHAFIWENRNVIYGGEGNKLFSLDKLKANFIAGNTLIISSTFKDMKELVELDGELGCLPFPKYDEAQSDYGSALNESNTLFGILVTAPDRNATAAVMEALASEGSRIVTPALYEVTLKTRYATDPAFAEMLDFIHDRVIFNFGSVYGYGMNAINTRYKGWVGTQTMNWMSSYEALRESTQKAIDEFCDKVSAFDQ